MECGSLLPLWFRRSLLRRRSSDSKFGCGRLFGAGASSRQDKAVASHRTPRQLSSFGFTNYLPVSRISRWFSLREKSMQGEMLTQFLWRRPSWILAPRLPPRGFQIPAFNRVDRSQQGQFPCLRTSERWNKGTPQALPRDPHAPDSRECSLSSAREFSHQRAP